MKTRIALVSLVAVAAAIGAAIAQVPEGAPAATVAPPPPATVAETQPVDLAICLDTSGSMSGLIESAKLKLWAVVNELASAKPTPDLRVALLHYGNDGLDEETGWTKVLLDLTVDLDKVYEHLFALSTNGGTEYVARAVTAAREQMAWSTDADALKIIFVCGNEEATQDPDITTQDACKAAITQDIIVNSIYCGDPGSNEALAWQEVAKLADGQYAAIDQDSGTVTVATPFDEELTTLSASINSTYIAFGLEGEERAANQVAQDSNAVILGAPAAAMRAQSKAGGMYRNATWDLVDASKEEDFDLSEIPDEQLPEEMRDMTLEEREAYIAEKAAEREAIQTKVAELGKKRDAYVRAEIEKQGLDETEALDFVIRNTVREQAVSKGFEFPEQPEVETEAGAEPAPEPENE